MTLAKKYLALVEDTGKDNGDALPAATEKPEEETGEGEGVAKAVSDIATAIEEAGPMHGITYPNFLRPIDYMISWADEVLKAESDDQLLKHKAVWGRMHTAFKDLEKGLKDASQEVAKHIKLLAAAKKREAEAAAKAADKKILAEQRAAAAAAVIQLQKEETSSVI